MLGHAISHVCAYLAVDRFVFHPRLCDNSAFIHKGWGGMAVFYYSADPCPEPAPLDLPGYFSGDQIQLLLIIKR